MLHEPFRQSCRPGESDTTVECKVRDFSITLNKFEHVGEMNKHLLESVSNLPTKGSCDKSWNVRGTWYNGDPNKPQGLIACYDNVDDEATVAWTNNRLLVEGFMNSTDLSERDALYSSWQEDTTD